MFRVGWVCKVINHLYCSSGLAVRLALRKLKLWPCVPQWGYRGLSLCHQTLLILAQSHDSQCEQSHAAQLGNLENSFWPPPSYCFSNETAAPTPWVLTSLFLGGGSKRCSLQAETTACHLLGMKVKERKLVHWAPVSAGRGFKCCLSAENGFQWVFASSASSAC